MFAYGLPTFSISCSVAIPISVLRKAPNVSASDYETFKENLKGLVLAVALEENARGLEDLKRSRILTLAPPAIAVLGEALHLSAPKWIGAALTIASGLVRTISEDQVHAVAKNLARPLVNETHDFIDTFNRGSVKRE